MEHARADGALDKAAVARRVFAALAVHSRLEEEIFYPALSEREDREGQRLVATKADEHGVVRRLIAELQTLAPPSATYEERFQALAMDVERHIDEEEHELFPDAERWLGSRLEGIGADMLALKRQLLTKPA